MEIGANSMWVIAIVLLLVMAIGRLFLKRRIRNQMEKIQEMHNTILHLRKIVDRLMPKDPCMTSLGSGIYCMKPATHIYQTVSVCHDCAQRLIENGANPPPKRYDFEAETFET